MNDKPDIYIGRGNAAQQDDYMDFINYVFGFNGDDSDFYKLLPKLYKPEYAPCASNYIVTEDGKFKAAIGAYDSVLSIAGTTFKRRGIGNVAVHPFSRSKGYMKTLMKMAVEDMIKDGVAISDLGGRRQRYGYFSYEKGCVHRGFHVNGHNLRYVYADRAPMPFTFNEINEGDTDVLDSVWAMSEAQPLHMVREREKLYDILINWRKKPYAVYDNDGFFGYFVRGGDNICELVLNDDTLAAEVLYAYMKSCGRWDMNISVPLFRPKQAAAFADLCEDTEVEHGEMISVFDFRAVVEALIKLSAMTSLKPLADGEVTLLIHGIAGDENVKITVLGGVPEVVYTDCKPDMELSHKHAISLLFGIYSPDRELLDAAPKSWLPLPITVLSSDAV